MERDLPWAIARTSPGGDLSRPNSWRSRLSAPRKRAARLRRVTSRHRRVLAGRGDGYGIRYDTPPRGLIVRVQAPMQLEPFEPAVHNLLTTEQCCRCPRRSRPSARRVRALRDLSEASRFGPRACRVLTGAGVGGTPPPPELLYGHDAREGRAIRTHSAQRTDNSVEWVAAGATPTALRLHRARQPHHADGNRLLVWDPAFVR